MAAHRRGGYSRPPLPAARAAPREPADADGGPRDGLVSWRGARDGGRLRARGGPAMTTIAWCLVGIALCGGGLAGTIYGFHCGFIFGRYGISAWQYHKR